MWVQMRAVQRTNLSEQRLPGFVDWLVGHLGLGYARNPSGFSCFCVLERAGYLSRARLVVVTRTSKSS